MWTVSSSSFNLNFQLSKKKGKHNFNKEDHTYINTYLS